MCNTGAARLNFVKQPHFYPGKPVLYQYYILLNIITKWHKLAKYAYFRCSLLLPGAWFLG
jgi:hypothetical protein